MVFTVPVKFSLSTSTQLGRGRFAEAARAAWMKAIFLLPSPIEITSFGLTRKLGSRRNQGACNAMSFDHLYRSVFQRLEGLNFHQVTLLVLLIVGFGFYCLRGFGSRHDY